MVVISGNPQFSLLTPFGGNSTAARMGIKPKYSVSEPIIMANVAVTETAVVRRILEKCMDQWGLAGARVLVNHFAKIVSSRTRKYPRGHLTKIKHSAS